MTILKFGPRTKAHGRQSPIDGLTLKPWMTCTANSINTRMESILSKTTSKSFFKNYFPSFFSDCISAS